MEYTLVTWIMRGKVCIIGSGPAGFYTAKNLLKAHPSLVIDMIDMLPTPFGLIRYGVAPDHQDTKNVTNEFTEIARNQRFRFFGNVKIGEQIPISDIRPLYDAVVLAQGSSSDRRLGIPGEDLQGVYSSRAFVNWYNGHPHFVNLPVDLSNVSSVAIIGQGNVAIDLARILLSPVDELIKTDIADHALEVFSRSKIERVSLIGRRGAVQSAFTTKELRELCKKPSFHCRTLLSEFNLSMTDASKEEMANRAISRKMKLLHETVVSDNESVFTPCVDIRFLLSPIEIIGNADGYPSQLVFQRNRLEGPSQIQKAVATEETLKEDFEMVLKSVGYLNYPIKGVPFDLSLNIIPNINGRVSGENRLYITGWAKRGAHGIIGSNIIDASETAHAVLEDLKNVTDTPKADLKDVLQSHSIEFTDWAHWERLNEIEVSAGKAEGRPRKKVCSIDEMLKI